MSLPKTRFFDTQATEHWAQAAYTAHETEKLLQTIRTAQISLGANVFEPGCGTGRLTQLLSSNVGPQGRVVALDMSPGMLDVCRARLAGTQNVRLMPEAMEDAFLVPNYFDAVICHNVFHHFEDKIGMLQKAAATLKPNGRFVIHHFLKFSEINNPARKIHDTVRLDLMPHVEQLQNMCSVSGMRLDYGSDSDDGFIMCATRTPLTGPVDQAERIDSHRVESLHQSPQRLGERRPLYD